MAGSSSAPAAATTTAQSLREPGAWLLYAAVSASASSSTLGGGAGVAGTTSLLNILLILIAIACVSVAVALTSWASPGGPAWGRFARRGPVSAAASPIPGPRGFPVLGSLLSLGPLAHRTLDRLSRQYNARPLLALSLANTRLIVASLPSTAKEILASTYFADRPIKQSARELLFDRAIGFAPYGDYWRKLRRIAASHLFSSKRIAEHESHRLHEIGTVADAISSNFSCCDNPTGKKSTCMELRQLFQRASLNNVMISVFGRRYAFDDTECNDGKELQAMVREGFELLGAFNLADHMPVLQALDSHRIKQRCEELVPRVQSFVSSIINEHRLERCSTVADEFSGDKSDFVHVLLDIQSKEGLSDRDMIAILWEMIFRGTDSVAILLEWILAELVLNPVVQKRLAAEINSVVGQKAVRDVDIPKLHYLQAVVYETLRLHPPGPLLSWARLATHDVEIAGHHVPAGTTAMVNMWAITHDPTVWSDPLAFTPERFLDVSGAGLNFDVRGNDLRLAPFGAGRRVCPGRAMGLATVNLWLAHLVQKFEFTADPQHEVDLSEVLKLSCEMRNPLHARVSYRHGLEEQCSGI